MEENFIPVYIAGTFEDLLGANVKPADMQPVLIPVNLTPLWRWLSEINKRCGTAISMIGYEDVNGQGLDVLIETLQTELSSLRSSPEAVVEWISEYQVGNGCGGWEDHRELRSVEKGELTEILEAIIAKAKRAKIEKKSLCFLGH